MTITFLVVLIIKTRAGDPTVHNILAVNFAYGQRDQHEEISNLDFLISGSANKYKSLIKIDYIPEHVEKNHAGLDYGIHMAAIISS